MKKALIIIGSIVVAAVAFFVMAPSSDSPDTVAEPKQTFASITADVKNGAKLIDVRTPEEYTAGHFTNAINFDSTKVEAGQYPSVVKDAKVYLYCRSGHRAGIVLADMKKAGFTNVTSLGGLTDVQALGGTLIQ